MNNTAKMICDNTMLKIWLGSEGTWDTKDTEFSKYYGAY